MIQTSLQLLRCNNILLGIYKSKIYIKYNVIRTIQRWIDSCISHIFTMMCDKIIARMRISKIAIRVERNRLIAIATRWQTPRCAKAQASRRDSWKAGWRNALSSEYRESIGFRVTLANKRLRRVEGSVIVIGRPRCYQAKDSSWTLEQPGSSVRWIEPTHRYKVGKVASVSNIRVESTDEASRALWKIRREWIFTGSCNNTRRFQIYMSRARAICRAQVGPTSTQKPEKIGAEKLR